jgi:hypothetical protein
VGYVNLRSESERLCNDYLITLVFWFTSISSALLLSNIRRKVEKTTRLVFSYIACVIQRYTHTHTHTHTYPL